MAHIEFLDQTIRDGQQSLWGMRLQAGMALPAAPWLDKSGFRVIDLTGSNHFEVLIRHCRENPWEMMDALVEAMPRTVLRSGMRSNASVTFRTTPDALMDAWMRQLNVHGARSFWIYDVLFNIDKMLRLAKVAKEFGSEVAGAIMFSMSPVHTDQYYADKVAKLAVSHDLDKRFLQPVADHFERVGKAAGFPVNQHNEYSVLSTLHQIPGGMTGTLKAQLAQHNMSDRFEEVLREVAVVRRELGYPGMATPFSQLVGTQAVLNVVTSERYAIVPDEIVEYAAGYYGEPVAPIQPDVLDRIMSSARAKEVLASPPEQPTIQELRKRYGTDDDDELILRALMPEPDLEKMRAAGPLKRNFPMLSSPELNEVARLMKTSTLPVLHYRNDGLSLTLKR